MEKTYQQVKSEYKNLFKKMMSYKPDQVGAEVYAEKMADLEENYPDFVEKIELEIEKMQ